MDNSAEKSLEEILQEINALLDEDESETQDLANSQTVKAAPTVYLSELDVSGMEDRQRQLLEGLSQAVLNMGRSFENVANALKQLQISIIHDVANEAMKKQNRRLPFGERKYRNRHPHPTPRMPASIRSATYPWQSYRARDRHQ